jgi:hypothetical protein
MLATKKKRYQLQTIQAIMTTTAGALKRININDIINEKDSINVIDR